MFRFFVFAGVCCALVTGLTRRTGRSDNEGALAAAVMPLLAGSEAAAVPVDEPSWAPFDFSDDSLLAVKFSIANGHPDLARRTLAVALSFRGTPYVHGTLENRQGPERLMVNLRQLDCWTFMENSLAIALAAGDTQDSLAFPHFVQKLRYWGGNVNGYGSRIHYFSGWLLQAEKTGWLDDLTQELGGMPYRKKIRYMSARPGKYPALVDPSAMRQLRAVEDRLSDHEWFFIPKNRVAKMEHLIREGDIIALTSWKSDLDIAHQGFAVKKNGRIHLLHASSLHGRVVLSSQPLPEYMATQKGQTGIMVARLRDADLPSARQ